MTMAKDTAQLEAEIKRLREQLEEALADRFPFAEKYAAPIRRELERWRSGTQIEGDYVGEIDLLKAQRDHFHAAYRARSEAHLTTLSELEQIKLALAAVEKERDEIQREANRELAHIGQKLATVTLARDAAFTRAEKAEKERDRLQRCFDERTNNYDALESECDEWKERAEKAEADATRLRANLADWHATNDGLTLKAERDRLAERVEKLKHLLAMVTVDEMGGTPDLFWPAGGWDDWDSAAQAALAESEQSAKTESSK